MKTKDIRCGNKNEEVKFSAHGTFREKSSSCTLKVKRLERQMF